MFLRFNWCIKNSGVSISQLDSKKKKNFRSFSLPDCLVNHVVDSVTRSAPPFRSVISFYLKHHSSFSLSFLFSRVTTPLPLCLFRFSFSVRRETSSSERGESRRTEKKRSSSASCQAAANPGSRKDLQSDFGRSSSKPARERRRRTPSSRRSSNRLTQHFSHGPKSVVLTVIGRWASSLLGLLSVCCLINFSVLTVRQA